MRLFVVLLLSIVGLVGCGSEAKLKKAPVSVSGKVMRSGHPCGGMVMVLQPLSDGHVRELSIRKDGRFQGELIPGEYAYYVAKPTIRGVAQATGRLASTHFEADLSRTVIVEPGKLLAIVLD